MNICEECGSMYDPSKEACPYCGCEEKTAYNEDEAIYEFIKEKK